MLAILKDFSYALQKFHQPNSSDVRVAMHSLDAIYTSWLSLHSLADWKRTGKTGTKKLGISGGYLIYAAYSTL